MYDNNGSVTVDQRTGVPSYQYGYNARGRLATSTKNTSTAAGAYGYDAFDSHVTRQTFGTGAFNRHYIFDAEGHLWAEHDAATGAVVREYIWLDNMPLAMVDYSSGTAKTYYIHTGQIGEPLMMTRNNQNVVWDDVIDPYGTATPLGTDSVALDLRYPGQWLQAETGGLAQNWFRDYDASLGRYAQADPASLDFGLNVYAYTRGFPTGLTDPFGLMSPEQKAACIAARAAILSTFARFERTLAKYNPFLDATGGFRKPGSGLTAPGGHYKKLMQLRSNLMRRVAAFERICSDDEDPPCAPLPASIKETLNSPIPEPMFPPAGENFKIPSPDPRYLLLPLLLVPFFFMAAAAG